MGLSTDLTVSAANSLTVATATRALGNIRVCCVFQTVRVNSEVVRVTAVDGDSTPANSRVTYYIVTTHLA